MLTTSIIAGLCSMVFVCANDGRGIGEDYEGNNGGRELHDNDRDRRVLFFSGNKKGRGGQRWKKIAEAHK